MSFNEETQRIMDRDAQLATLVDSDGWRIAKERLIKLLIDNSSITDITGTPEQIAQEVGMRQGVVGIITSWLDEIESSVGRVAQNNELMKEESENEIIKRFNS